MFSGDPAEQFHQFIDSTTPLHLHVSPPTLSIHDHLQPSHHHQVFQSHHDLLQQLHHPSSTHEEEDRVRSVSEMMNRQPWLKEEVLALLTIRSSMGSGGFSEFIWGHVSRKLAELGFKRSAEKCKDKFEEVSKYYCNNTNYGNNYRSFRELEGFFEDQNHESLEEKMVRNSEGEKNMGLNLEENPGNGNLENRIVENQYEVVVLKEAKIKKRKRYHKFKLLKDFTEVVNKIMVQQEEMHMKLLEDMERKEEERIAREESWRKEKMDRLNKEIEIRAQEQAIACDRESTIIDFLNNFTPTTRPSQNYQGLVVQNEELKAPNDPNPNFIPNEGEDHGKRWPKEEVYSLINLRGNLYSIGTEDKESSTKVPIWERISQGMLELGYRRSAKKCKEKWENINKYFRRTKDANKKRSLDSKTCPYFHQLSNLYNQGRLMLPSEEPENHLNSTEIRLESCQGGFSEAMVLVAHEGDERNVVQASPLVFEY